jgi:hypothetical protein
MLIYEVKELVHNKKQRMQKQTKNQTKKKMGKLCIYWQRNQIYNKTV